MIWLVAALLIDTVRLELRGDWIEVRESDRPGILEVEYSNSASMSSATERHYMHSGPVVVDAHVMVQGAGPERFKAKAEGYIADPEFCEVEDGGTCIIRLIPAMF